MFKEKLLEMKKESEGITLFVIEDILAFNDNDEDIASYIDNVLTYGCVSGCVSSLTYYYQTKDLFSKYLVFGITFWISFQTILNLMVVVGLIPVTGVTLPFLSYGGSSLLILYTSIGIILNVSRYQI